MRKGTIYQLIYNISEDVILIESFRERQPKYKKYATKKL